MRKLQPGDRIKLTGKFLRNTGQVVGGEGQSTWTVVACNCSLCQAGRFVATDEPSSFDSMERRHLATANVYRVGTLDARNVS